MNNFIKSKVSDLGEFGLIEHLVGKAINRKPSAILGPGDDCAVLPLSSLFPTNDSGWVLLTTDTMVEERHFKLGFSSAFDLGWKLMAVNLSDIAAMGGVPRVALITLKVPADTEVEFLDQFYNGMTSLGGYFDLELAGGDTVQGTELSFGLTMLGTTVVSPLLRSGARPGDELWVSGSIGGAGTGLKCLQGRLSLDLFPKGGEDILARHRRPSPRVVLGQELLRRGLPSSMIDVSDGLIQDLGHISRCSGVIIELNPDSVPYHAGILKAGITKPEALTSGDDYELLFTAPRSANEGITEISRLGSCGEDFPVLTCIGQVRDLISDGVSRVEIRLNTGDVGTVEDYFMEQNWVYGSGFQHFTKNN